MRKFALILFALLIMLGNALAQSSGEYKAFVYNRPTGCIGQTTEEGGIPDCYDATQNWARYTWSQTLRQYVPGPEATLTVAKLPICTDSFAKNAIAVVSDSTNSCVAGNALTGGGSFVCPVFCNGTAWSILGAAGSGASGVQTINGGTGINITGTTSSPIINLTTPVSTTNGGTGVSAPTAHTLLVAEGVSPFTPLTCGVNLPLIGGGASVDPSCQQLNLTVGVTGILPLANGGTGTDSPTTVASLPTCNSAGKGLLDTVTDSTNTCVDGSALVGSGSNVCVVFCNGSSWQMVGTVSGSTGMVNPMTTLGDMIYENATPAATRLAGSTASTKKFLTQTGTGSVSAAPAWGTVACSDLPALTGDTTTSAGSCATTTSAVQNNSLVPNRVTTSGATLSVNLSASLNQFITLHDTITLSFSSPPADGNVVRFKLTQSNGGSHTVTWPASVQWSSGTAPTLTTTDGKADFVQCLYDGTTTNYDCSSVLNFTP